MHTHCTKQTVSQVTKKEKERKEGKLFIEIELICSTHFCFSVCLTNSFSVCLLSAFDWVFMCVCSLADVLSSFFAEEKRQRTTVLFCFCSVQFWCCWYSTTSGTSTFDALSDKSLVLFFFTLTCNYVLSSVLLFVAAARLIIAGGARKSYLAGLFVSIVFLTFLSFLYRSLINWPLNVCVRCRGWDHFSSSNVIYNISNRTPNSLTSGQKKLLPLLLLLLLLLS